MTERDKNKFYHELGEAIYTARKKMNFSQEKLSIMVGMSRVSIVNIEKGRQNPPLHLLWSISECLQVSVCDLIPKFHSSEEEINIIFQKRLKTKSEESFIEEDSLIKINKFLRHS